MSLHCTYLQTNLQQLFSTLLRDFLSSMRLAISDSIASTGYNLSIFFHTPQNPPIFFCLLNFALLILHSIMRHVTILGAGLTGPLLALYFARRGYRVDVYEQRPDFREHGFAGGRSINLALSDRGIRGLEGARVDDEVMKDAIPMKGRMVHDLDGEIELQPYSRRGRHINSISRGGLNITMVNASEYHEDVKFHFDLACTDVDLERKQIKLRHTGSDEEIIRDVDLLFAADGANSALRQAMERDIEGFTARTDWLTHGYKELVIPPGPNGEFLIEKNALHIWPRHDFMMIALANPDATFTCTLFAPMEGENSFDEIKDR